MKDLKPSSVWAYFEEILEIPRLSKNEERIIEYLAQFAKKNNLPFKKDAVGNCLITKPAALGFENRETVILQSHLDMVGEKLLEVRHDFNLDPIKAKMVDGWITAEGTTLGADDGIGVAAAMAVLSSEDIIHGPLECLFTVDEETGMTGAFGLEDGFLKGTILLNLDSEDEGELYIGCAGGIDTIGSFKKEVIPVPENSLAYKITVEGLQGGHSGDEIHKGFGNSIKIINRILQNLDKRSDIYISKIEGGKLRNAIPRDSYASIVFSASKLAEIKEIFSLYQSKLTGELIESEPGIKISFEEDILPAECFEKSFQQKMMSVFADCPHGVIGWSKSIEGLVETSTNMAIVREMNDHIELHTSQRSSSRSEKDAIAGRINDLFKSAGGSIKSSLGYPGWNPNKDSVILRIAEQTYLDVFNSKPEVKAIHAGLECGLFLQKYPELDMISFGPTIKGAHTPEERIDIQSVEKFWDFLVVLLRNIPVIIL